jgi:hypothetical protein
MTRFVAVLSALCLLMSACGGISTLGGGGKGATTVTTEPAVEGCADANDPEVLVATSTSGFSPWTTIVVRNDGRASYTSMGEPTCFAVPPTKLAELRRALEEADLARVPACEPSREGPMVIETDTRTVTYKGMSISITEPCDGPPPRVQRLFHLLVALPSG